MLLVRRRSYSESPDIKMAFSFLVYERKCVESGETWHRDPLYNCFHTQRTYRQAQLALVVLPRKAMDFCDCFANVRANVSRLLLRSLRIM